MPPTVADAIREGQRGIRALEPAVVADLLGQYELAWRAVERILRRYEGQIQAAYDAKTEPRPSWLRQQVWYRQVQASIDAEMSRFEADAARTLARGQAQAVGISAESAALFAEAVGVSGSIVPQVYSEAFERWVSALRPGSPVRDVLHKYGPRFEDAIARHITEGLATGQSPRTMVRAIEREVGPLATRGRLHTIARTETMRALRGASRDQMTAMGRAMPGTHVWRWRAAKSTRTCISCLAYDNRTFPFDRYPDRFHPSCRCVVSLEPDRSLVPAMGRPRESGAEWFARQDEADQRAMLPTVGHWEAFQRGVPLADMVTVRTSPVWGESLAIMPASRLRGAA